MPDFESCLNEACESVMLEVLDASGKRSTSWWLGQSGVSFSDCSKRPQDFDDALVSLFQPMGAIVIEAKILERLYRGQGASYRRGDRLNFAGEVEEARRLFEEALKSAEKVGNRARGPPPNPDPE
ncbi:MAG: hypothetical protein ACLQEQ_08225 [Nitrososphaerales archaeon]